MIASITNFLQIDPNLGTAGQPTREQLAAVRDAGYEVVINLLPPESEAYLPDEEAVVRGLGMEYISIPVFWTAPTRQNLEQFFAALDRHRPRKVFVHCMMNMRVTAFVFLYRALREGAPVAEARRIMEPVWEPNPVWAQFIEESLSTDYTDDTD
ncbi:MAG TPA: protein tyrosine phosphatase family protein [Anaerolineaceae bacterium]|nr:protein tyrosine phosphatase family protein [Anaerolineaceae bacterium]